MIKMIAVSEKARINIRIMSMQLCEQNAQKKAPREAIASRGAAHLVRT
jgi:hypothetical protein